jgi:acyl-CoA dehydrogenase
MIQQTAHEFAEKEIRPHAAYFDEHEEFPRDIVGKANELGLSAGIFGSGGPMAGVLIAEELAWGCAGIALAIAASGLAGAAILGIGTPEQQEKFLPMAFGEGRDFKLGAMGLTEPEAGSDVQAIATTAVRDGDDYVLNGTKRFITNGGIADVHVIFATEDKSKGWGGLAAFVVEKGTPGLTMGTVWKKMGIRASHTADVILEDCRIPAENRLGVAPGRNGDGGAPAVPGALGALKMLERTRPSIGAFSLGVARAALEYATEYAKERKQFGKPLIAQEGIAFKLADMAMAYDSAKLLVHRAARRRGIAERLMDALEREARAEGRTLLVLDTVTGDPAERLYEKLGWSRVGVIPGYALYPDGRLCDTTVFYKYL